MPGVSLPTAGPGSSDWGRTPDVAGRSTDPREGAEDAHAEAEHIGQESPGSPTSEPPITEAPTTDSIPSEPPTSEAPTTEATLDGSAPADPVPAARGLPGAWVALAATGIVIVTAAVEVMATGDLATWAGLALMTVAILSALVTRRGDLVLPVIMPPLAFLAATLVAGQALVESGSDPWWVRCALMVFEVLGRNAVWVVLATACALVICVVRWTVARLAVRRQRGAALT